MCTTTPRCRRSQHRSTSGWHSWPRPIRPSRRSIDGEGDEHRWYVRLRGEEKEHITVWLTLGQRTLRYEAYVMPAPEENVAQVYEMALAPQREVGRRPLRDRRGGCAVPARRTAARRGVRRRGRSRGRVDLRVLRAELPFADPPGLRQPLRQLTSAESFTMKFPVRRTRRASLSVPGGWCSSGNVVAPSAPAPCD